MYFRITYSDNSSGGGPFPFVRFPVGPDSKHPFDFLNDEALRRMTTTEALKIHVEKSFGLVFPSTITYEGREYNPDYIWSRQLPSCNTSRFVSFKDEELHIRYLNENLPFVDIEDFLQYFYLSPFKPFKL